MAYTNRNFTWDFDALKRFYERYIVKWLNSAISWTEAQKKQARANLGFGDGDIDAEPTSGSDNLVKSGGVYGSISNINGEILQINNTLESKFDKSSIVQSLGNSTTDVPSQAMVTLNLSTKLSKGEWSEYIDSGANKKNGWYSYGGNYNTTGKYSTIEIDIQSNQKYKVSCVVAASTALAMAVFLDENGTGCGYLNRGGASAKTYTDEEIPLSSIPANAKKLCVSSANPTNPKIEISTYSEIDINSLGYYPLKGKNILCFGDSITEFTNSTDGKGYPEHLAALSGATVLKAGIAGTRIATRRTPQLEPEDTLHAYGALDIASLVHAYTTEDYSYVDAANSYLITHASDDNTTQINLLKATPIASVDIITIFAGTNDYNGGNALGTVDSTSSMHVMGALKNIIADILTANPKIKIYVFTPLVRYFNSIAPENWCDVYVNATEKKLPDYVKGIEDAAVYCHIPCCNWYYDMGWNQSNFTEYYDDTTHPTKGFKKIADRMYGYIVSHL